MPTTEDRVWRLQEIRRVAAEDTKIHFFASVGAVRDHGFCFFKSERSSAAFTGQT